MADVLLRFVPDKGEIDTALQNIKQETQELIKDVIIPADNESQRIAQDIISIQTDLDSAEKIKVLQERELETQEEKLARLSAEMGKTQEMLNVVEQELIAMPGRLKAQQAQMNLEEQAKFSEAQLNAQGVVDQFKTEIEELKAEIETTLAETKSEWNFTKREISGILAFATASIALFQAVSGDVVDETLQFMLSMGLSSISMFFAYAAIGKASGNLFLLAASASAISSTASMINMMKAFSRRNEQRIQERSRRTQTFKIG